MTLIEATLQVREDLIKNTSSTEKDRQLLKVQLQNWIEVSLQVAEIASKVLDWKTKNPNYIKRASKAQKDKP